MKKAADAACQEMRLLIFDPTFHVPTALRTLFRKLNDYFDRFKSCTSLMADGLFFIDPMFFAGAMLDIIIYPHINFIAVLPAAMMDFMFPISMMDMMEQI
jgi:hypothetical protein